MSLICATAAIAPFARGQTGTVDRAQALERWMEARLLLSKEREEWRVQRSILEDRIELLDREIETWRARARTADEDLARTEEQWRELSEQLENLKSGTASLAPALAALERRVRAILPRLPPPLASRLEPLSRRIPENPDTTRLGLGERFQNVIGILNEINKSAREITVISEVRELADGEHAEVTTMYVGLALAYFCNEKAGIAGVGYPQPGGWRWERHDDKTADIAAAIAIYRNERPAAYVALPARIGNRGEERP